MAEGGIVDTLKGRVKEALGSLLGSRKLKNEGRVDQTAGKAKEKTGEAVDKARDALTGDDRDRDPAASA